MNLRLVFKTLDAIALTLAAHRIYQFMANPKSGKLRDFELDVLDKAEKEDFTFEDFSIRKYKWGNSNKRVLLYMVGKDKEQISEA